jgi:hypothetical protein
MDITRGRKVNEPAAQGTFAFRLKKTLKHAEIVKNAAFTCFRRTEHDFSV